MSQQDSTPEVACTLTEEQKAERSEEVRSLLVSHYAGYEEVDGSVEIRFDGTEESPPAVARFVADESNCCSFAEYEIVLSPPYEETVLRISGPEGTREMFREGLAERLEEKSA